MVPKEPVQSRRNPRRHRRPPKKLSYHSVVVEPVSDKQKIEIGRRLWQEAKERKMLLLQTEHDTSHIQSTSPPT